MSKAVRPEIQVEVLSVNPEKFVSEIVAQTREEIVRYNIDVKTSIFESNINSIDINQQTKQDRLYARIWGSFMIFPGAESNVSLSEYRNSNEILSIVKSLSRQHNLKINIKKMKSSSQVGEFLYTPVRIKISGQERNCLNFLEKLQSQSLNYKITRINGKPIISGAQSILQMNISAIVFVPV